MRWSPSAATPGPPPASATEEETLVGLVHLLQEDESEDSVGAQAGIVWCKALPQAEEALEIETYFKFFYLASPVQFSSVTQSCLTLCNPMNHSTPGLPVHHQLPQSTQTHVH